MQTILTCASFSGWNSFQNTLEAASQWCCYRGDSKPWEKALRGGHRKRHSELCFTYTSVIGIYFMQHCCNCWSYKCKLLNSTDNSSAQKAKQLRMIFSLFSFYLITNCQRAQENFLWIVFFSRKYFECKVHVDLNAKWYSGVTFLTPQPILIGT